MNVVRSIGETAARTAIDAAWAQWSALTTASTLVDDRCARSIVDPEALIVVSLAFGDEERRLGDLVAACAREASFLISVKRLQTVASIFSAGAVALTGEFARYAAEEGDRRWRHLVPAAMAAGVSRVKPLGPLRITDGPALTLRLRAGFGVNAKADLLSVLLGRDGAATDLKTLASATGYTQRNLRIATAEMTLARFIEEIPGRPSSFSVHPSRWALVLQQSPLPPWRYWAAIFAFLTGVSEWAKQSEDEEWSAYVASSKARDVYEAHESRLRLAQIDLEAQPATRGSEFLEVFDRFVTRLSATVIENV